MDSLKIHSIFLLILFAVVSSADSTTNYKVGVGRADCTGPSVEITFMGYAKFGQFGCGIHLRQFARAFIFDDGIKTIAFVSVDACMIGYSLKNKVIKELQQLYGDTYSHENVILSGTHTHSAPGGFLVDELYDISILGFSNETFTAYTNGIVRAIQRAHENIDDAYIYFNSGELIDANINRSPASYEKNPEEEKNRYTNNTDKTFAQLKIIKKSDGKLIGAIHWYAVHPVSLNNTNCLVTSDNVGYASILLESQINLGSLPGQGDFVGSFASSNLGDVSPNLNGPICINTGEQCDKLTSTCNGEAKYCIAMGPGKDMYESLEMIASRLVAKSWELLDDGSTSQQLNGPIDFIHQWVDMPKQSIEVKLDNGTTQQINGCVPAMGYAFGAGTTDGPGDFDFIQGSTKDSKFWNALRDIVFPPTEEDISCHSPKPILITSGRIQVPYSWQPEIVSTQIVTIGNFGIIAVPGEFTTMSGRRLREIVKKSIGNEDIQVVIAGLSNTYTSYIATYEEYQVQRFEGAATIFGPHTLQIYLSVYEQLAKALAQNKSVDPGPSPVDILDKNTPISLILPVVVDSSSWYHNFGDVILQPPELIYIDDTVNVTFVAGNPRNNVMQEETFLTVEKLNEDNGNWTVIATDGNIETRFFWRRTDILTGTSEATVQWKTNNHIAPGTHRIQHFGYYKSVVDGNIYPYSGTSNNFEVLDHF